jgi:[ribosomal protein S18]-alanine N-acetyltransferase
MIEANPAHAQILAELHAIAFPEDAWDAASFKTLLTQPGILALIDERGGFLVLRKVLDEAEVITIGVTTPRQGTGRALMQNAIAHATRHRILKIHLEVATQNTAARALYAALGFTQTGRRKTYYPDGSDALTLTLALRAEPELEDF